MAVFFTGGIHAFRTEERHDNPNKADGDDGLGFKLDGGEEAVDVVGPVGEDLDLFPATSAGG